ncbi:MFS transporter, partial [Rhodopseudomonas sp. BAL398]|uniref:MFS transporter n=1 Tax=Rhodopseudomonas sp. BAL398 TaxID=3034676 RepID=UPI0023E33EE3
MTDQAIPPTVAASPVQAGSIPLQIAVLAALAAMGTLATNILLPSLPQIAASLQVSTASVTASITVFLAVFALGQLAVGPISDRYGRRVPVLAGFVIFIAGSIWCGLASDLTGLLIGRVIQAAGACATSVLWGGGGARGARRGGRGGGPARVRARDAGARRRTR